jgi:ubiquinone biosynthesis protein
VSGNQRRYREITQVLSRHGMDYLVGALGLERWVPFHRSLPGSARREARYTRPEHVRLALQELGATFVKLGQVVSTRPDLLPEDLQRELAKLQDSGQPVPADAIREILSAELGRSPEEVFASFDLEPLASASIGQAHAATLADGTEVVVKVRRPGVVEQVHNDLEMLRNLAVRASRRWTVAADYDVEGLATEFADTLEAELDYLQEARNAERFAENFTGDPDVHIPRVFWETTTSRVLTLERLRGIKVSDVAALDAAGIDRRALAARATRVTAEMVFVHGFFHADPHPGNLFIQPDGGIGILDFGMVGEVDELTRHRLALLLAAFARRDPDRIASAVLEIGGTRRPVDRAALSVDAAGLLRKYEGRPLGDIPVAAFIGDVLAILRRHHVALPRELALLLRMVVMLEGMGAQLDPGFQLGHVLVPYAQRLVAAQFDLAGLGRRIAFAAQDVGQFGLELPDHVRRLLDVLERGRFDVALRADEVEPLVARIERTGNRLVVGVVVAAFIEGLAELAAADPQRWRSHEPKLVTAAIGVTAGLTGYLAWTARGPRRRG